MCQKMRFASRGEAKAHARHESDRTGNPRLKAYFCEPCGSWHLSKRTRRDGRQMRRRGLGQ